MASGHVKAVDLVQPFVEGLADIVDMAAIQKAGLTLGVDPLGGSGIEYWKRIAEHYKLNLTLVNDQVDQTFRFMHLDKDGAIRMDCSSECAMAGLLALRDKFDLAFANDPDYDRHGIVTPAGLMNPNHYLAVAINYLFQHRPLWGKDVAVGKTLVSSAMIDRVVNDLGRKLVEVPVGFKWFVDGLFDGSFGFGGEESAGASFLRFDGTPWSTDKDGIIMCLLAAEITAVTGKTRKSITMNWQRVLARRAITVCRRARPPRRKRHCLNCLRKWSAPARWQATRSPRVLPQRRVMAHRLAA